MRRAPERPLRVVAIALGVGLAWIAIEAVVTVATLPALSLAELGTRLVRVLPWHLAIFAGWGAAFALVPAVRRMQPAGVWWSVLGAGSFTFLGARVVEGLMRSGGPTAAAVGVVATALGIAAGIALLAALARLVPARWRRGWHAGAGVAWTVGFVVFLERAGYEIGRAGGRLVERPRGRQLDRPRRARRRGPDAQRRADGGRR
ncbi:MAG: hypothetical protein DCC71_19005, partial [Proteobacteria bacterium]